MSKSLAARRMIPIDNLPVFFKVRNVRPEQIGESLRSAVRGLHESEELEPFLRTILSDSAATPHGPAELTDILTHQVLLGQSAGLGAFILKGRSFSTVRPKDVSHQIYRLEKIEGLHFAAFGATGVLLDAAKEQFVSTCERLNIAYSLINIEDFARLFWAYGFLCPRDGSRILGGRCHCGYAPDHSILNVLQTEALAELERAHEREQTRGLVVLPPGSGKTRIAAKDARTFGARNVLYVAHTHEILDVADAEFAAVFGARAVCRLGSGRTKARGIQLTTIQYLAEHLDKISERKFDYIVVDEFHHAAARTYKKVVDTLTFRFLLGLTATPFRGDRQDIAELCHNNVVVSYELRTGIETGILSPYHYFGCFDDVDYSDLPVSGRYTVRDLERKLIIRERHNAVVGKWRERAEGKPSLAFCCSHLHAERVAEAFRQQGVPAAVYLSGTPVPTRQTLIEQLRTGKLKILCVVDVLNEGADVPFVECLLFLRPTESKRIFLQQLGRGLRKYVGKSHCTVIDFIGNFRNAYKIVEYHGLRPEEANTGTSALFRPRNVREVLDLPLGCKVTFEDRVLSIFSAQADRPRNATRDNIGRILIYEYERLSQSLGRKATAKDLDRYNLLGARFYRTIFGGWEKFEQLVSDWQPVRH